MVYFKSEAKNENAILDARVAMRMSNDASLLKQWANDALRSILK